jgi:hypothetical protein
VVVPVVAVELVPLLAFEGGTWSLPAKICSTPASTFKWAVATAAVTAD